MGTRYKISDEKFIEIAIAATSICNALKAMGIRHVGGNYDTFRRRVSELNLDLPYMNIIDRHQFADIRKDITNEQIISACKESRSRKQSLYNLGLHSNAGSNVRWIISKIEELTIDVSHWLGRRYLLGGTHNRGKPIEHLLNPNKYTSTCNLKKRLLKSNMLECKCNNCGITEWLGQKLSLHLHHIDGNRKNNLLKNIILLCPNCHSLTDNYCNKND